MLRDAQELRDGGQVTLAEDGHPPSATIPQPELPGEGQTCSATKGRRHAANTGQPHRSEEGQGASANGGQEVQADLASTISLIRYHHRMRSYAMDQRKRSDLSLGAFVRTALGWSKALPDAERKVIADRAKALIDLGEKDAKGKAADTDEPAYIEWREIILASIAARQPFNDVEKRASGEMEALARTLPVWPWFSANVFKSSALQLAIIVAEAGDLSQYPKKGHLWKRMGLAVMGAGDGAGDVRQGGLRKAATADDWIAHGYSAKRRSQIWVIGDILVKGKSAYRDVYLRRKDYERVQAAARGLTIAPAAKIPKKRAAEFISDGHIHKRAQRYMEKIMLRDLWQAWRDA